jgi:hypothetical protein
VLAVAEGYGQQVKKAVIVALPLVAVLYLVSLWVHPARTVKVSKVEPGQCIDTPASPVAESLRKRDCDDRHTAEVFAVFRYPGTPRPGQASPEENCLKSDETLTPELRALQLKLIEAVNRPDVHRMVVSNRADLTKDRDYACIVTFTPREGSFLSEALGTG